MLALYPLATAPLAALGDQSYYSYTASGGLNLGSTATVLPRYIYLPSGNLVLGSTATVRPRYIYVASGGLSLGDTATVRPRYVYNIVTGGLNLGSTATVRPRYVYNIVTGGLNLGSTATVRPRYIYLPAGNLVIGSTVTVKPTYLYTASGGLSLGNAVTTQFRLNYTTSGGLNFGDTSTVKPTYLYTASGGLNIGGEAEVSSSFAFFYFASGRLGIGGTSTVQPTYLYTASGGLNLGDSSTVQPTYLYTASGGLTLGDSVTVKPTYLYTASGKLNIAGTSTVQLIYVHTASGGLSLGDSVTVRPTYLYRAFGGLSLGDTSVGRLNYLFTASGSLNLSGISVIGLTLTYSASGALTLRGTSVSFISRYVYGASGGLSLGGTGILRISYYYLASGILNLGGSGVSNLLFKHSASGSLNSSGFASLAFALNYCGSGNLMATGSSSGSSEASFWEYVGFGKFSLRGNAFAEFTFTDRKTDYGPFVPGGIHACSDPLSKQGLLALLQNDRIRSWIESSDNIEICNLQNGIFEVRIDGMTVVIDVTITRFQDTPTLEESSNIAPNPRIDNLQPDTNYLNRSAVLDGITSDSFKSAISSTQWTALRKGDGTVEISLDNGVVMIVELYQTPKTERIESQPAEVNVASVESFSVTINTIPKEVVLGSLMNQRVRSMLTSPDTEDWYAEWVENGLTSITVISKSGQTVKVTVRLSDSLEDNFVAPTTTVLPRNTQTSMGIIYDPLSQDRVIAMLGSNSFLTNVPKNRWTVLGIKNGSVDVRFDTGLLFSIPLS
jgi:hypothetical protein